MESALRSLIDWYERAGVDVPPLPAIKPAPRAIRAGNSASMETKRQSLNPPTSRSDLSRGTSDTQTHKDTAQGVSNLIEAATQAAKTAKTLEGLQVAVKKFDAGRLSDNARGAVFSRGNLAAKLMVIGEAPSHDDDIKAEPFMGREGALLSRMLGAIGFTDDDVYLTLSVNWRLPQGRTPKAAEIDVCRPFLRRHIELAKPSHILMLGSTPMSALTDITSIMKHHGQWKNIKIGEKDIPALPMYHPSLLLTQSDLKKDAWRDLLSLRAALAS
ncbi:MAG: uracil-DNA glycosylase [Litorimonas sp.]